jgi:NDP-sugar pyrophosphorylase family protein
VSASYAVILAGGRGTRLRPYTTTIPKPLVPVGERAILDIVLRRLRAAGVREVRMAVNHMADLIMAFFGDGAKFGLAIRYAVEDQPLGTVGPLAAIDDLPENFIVMNGDVLTDLDHADLFRRHVASGARLTLSTQRRTERIDFGVLEVDPSGGQLVGFREKPCYDFTVSMGVYVFHRSLVERIPSGRPFGLDELVLGMLADGERIHTYPHDGYWLDLGRPDDYERANREIDRLFPEERADGPARGR